MFENNLSPMVLESGYLSVSHYYQILRIDIAKNTFQHKPVKVEINFKPYFES